MGFKRFRLGFQMFRLSFEMLRLGFAIHLWALSNETNEVGRFKLSFKRIRLVVWLSLGFDVLSLGCERLLWLSLSFEMLRLAIEKPIKLSFGFEMVRLTFERVRLGVERPIRLSLSFETQVGYGEAYKTWVKIGEDQIQFGEAPGKF